MTIHQEIYTLLIDIARRGELITYAKVAPLADLNMENPADRNRIANILGDISTYEHQHNRPMLSALVVLAEAGYPGEGFFKLARALGVHHGHGEFADMEFFVEEVKKVYGYWQNH